MRADIGFCAGGIANEQSGGGGAYSESYSYWPSGRFNNGPLGASCTYGSAAHLHAVTGAGGNSYSYDANGLP
ncbi:MAG TPA: hypothetical protein PKE45_14960 [Caldilineaceae bacterium]|nr:hypothetical protein [Caldilineaceae bacterium]